MPDLLLELRSEEIPARMQRKAAGDLRKMVTNGLVDVGLTYEGCQEYWTPRRLVLDIRGVTARSRDVREEKKGPRFDAPQPAIQGFLKSVGIPPQAFAYYETLRPGESHSAGSFPVVSVEEIKGQTVFMARMERKGRAAEDIIAELIPSIIRDFPWPKSMRWGPASARPGSLRWVRPLQSIVCTFGPETEEPVVVDFEVDGIRSGNVTYGHRFHAPDAITVRRFDDYAAKLEAAKVIIDADRRKQIILSDAKNLAFANGLHFVEDEGLLEEVSGLVEWPVVLMGEFDEAFLEIPAEVIRLTIRANQKCFVTRGAADEHNDDGGLSNRFLLVSNIAAKDGGREIAYGNGKVVRARLSDALYFWKTDQHDLPDLDQLKESAEKFDLDLTKPLDQRMARLDRLGVTFHAKLGTQGERVERIARLAEEIAPVVGADPARARRAVVLAKADLQTEVVGEFPELQGLIGRKYAALQGEHPSVAAAIEEHYKPQGPSDRVPADPVSIAVALADKLDTLVGFWAIDEKPTGSKDPYALRRAALGVIRVVVENGVRLGLQDAFQTAALAYLLYSGFRPARDHMHGGYRDIIGAREDSNGVLTGGPWTEYPYRHYLNYDGFVDQLGPAASAAELGVPEALDDFDEETAYNALRELEARTADMETFVGVLDFVDDGFEKEGFRGFYLSRNYRNELWIGAARAIGADLLSFFHDRLKVYLRDQGARHDLIDAVLAAGSRQISPLEGEMSAKPTEGGGQARRETPPSALPAPRPFGSQNVGFRSADADQASTPSRGEISQLSTAEGRKGDRPSADQAIPAEASERSERSAGSALNDDLLLIVRRVEALGSLLDTEDGKNLLAGTKRAANILAAEEKKGTRIAESVDPALFSEPAEKLLFEAVNQAETEAGQAIQAQDFAAAMRALGALREPVDAFFDRVLVNHEDERIRANRLALLARIRNATDQVADFSKIAG